jgi:hypothetical protein
MRIDGLLVVIPLFYISFSLYDHGRSFDALSKCLSKSLHSVKVAMHLIFSIIYQSYWTLSICCYVDEMSFHMGFSRDIPVRFKLYSLTAIA